MVDTTEELAREILLKIEDPEIPGLSILDLGIVREVEVHGGRIEVSITPTYSGCPALEVIREAIESALQDAGFKEVRVSLQHAPPWTSEWITPRGREVLRQSGIAPPEAQQQLHQIGSQTSSSGIACPRCGLRKTIRKSEYGATSCKSLWYCSECREPFEYFKSF